MQTHSHLESIGEEEILPDKRRSVHRFIRITAQGIYQDCTGNAKERSAGCM